jgi:hypothetical protein
MHSNAAGSRNHPILRFLAMGLLAAAATAGLCAVDGTAVARVAGIGVPFVANQARSTAASRSTPGRLPTVFI